MNSVFFNDVIFLSIKDIKKDILNIKASLENHFAKKTTQ